MFPAANDAVLDAMLTISKVAKVPELRRNGKPLHPATVHRWMAAGRLRFAVVGGVRLSCRRWVREMIASDSPAPAVTYRDDVDAAELDAVLA